MTVHQGRVPDGTDSWDANWLDVAAEVDLPGQAWVRATGPFLMTSDLAGFLPELRRMHETLTGTADLHPLEPDLRVHLECGSTGQLLTEIELTPDHPTQSHIFELELDQTYLPGIIRQLDTILERFPVRGRPD
ncbi:WapI family immunity protein [Deinococcus depolymerans]|uniref:WapI family immunity protein n=1 Tax=Deinococcus depolymerans TaxID=392408 RepID=UPI0031D7D078